MARERFPFPNRWWSFRSQVLSLESLKETIGNAGDTDPLRHPRGLRIYNNMLCIHTFQKRLVSFVSRTGGNLILILKDYGTVEALTLAAITRI